MGKRTRTHQDQLAFDWRVKNCCRCKQDLPGNEFAAAKNVKDGLSAICKPCYSAYWAEYYTPEKAKQISARRKAWRQRNADAIRERKRLYRLKHLETERARENRYRLNNLEARREACREWHRTNKDLAQAARRRRRARQAAVQHVPFTSAQLKQRWSYYGDKCWVCGAEAVASDHVKPIIEGGAHMLSNLRPICQPCNSRKGGRWPFDVEWIRSGAAIL